MMAPADRDEMFRIMLEISDQQFDAQAKKRLRAMLDRSNEDIKDELMGLIDDIVYYSWSSSFELTALKVIWKEIGGSDQELEERNRNGIDTPENRAKYKWER